MFCVHLTTYISRCVPSVTTGESFLDVLDLRETVLPFDKRERAEAAVKNLNETKIEGLVRKAVPMF